MGAQKFLADVIDNFLAKYGENGKPTLSVTQKVTRDHTAEDLPYRNYILNEGWDRGYDALKGVIDRFDMICQKQEVVNNYARQED
jgi:hypothetical protein